MYDAEILTWEISRLVRRAFVRVYCVKAECDLRSSGYLPLLSQFCTQQYLVPFSFAHNTHLSHHVFSNLYRNTQLYQQLVLTVFDHCSADSIIMASLTTLHLEHLPPSLVIYIAHLRDVRNASFLRQQLLAGNAEFEYALVDANTVRFEYGRIKTMINLYRFSQPLIC